MDWVRSSGDLGRRSRGIRMKAVELLDQGCRDHRRRVRYRRLHNAVDRGQRRGAGHRAFRKRALLLMPCPLVGAMLHRHRRSMMLSTGRRGSGHPQGHQQHRDKRQHLHHHRAHRRAIAVPALRLNRGNHLPITAGCSSTGANCQSRQRNSATSQPRRGSARAVS